MHSGHAALYIKSAVGNCGISYSAAAKKAFVLERRKIMSIQCNFRMHWGRCGILYENMFLIQKQLSTQAKLSFP